MAPSLQVQAGGRLAEADAETQKEAKLDWAGCKQDICFWAGGGTAPGQLPSNPGARERKYGENKEENSPFVESTEVFRLSYRS